MNGFSFLLLVAAFAIGAHADGEKERLVGAQIAEIGEFPYQISLRLKNEHFCGGAFITKRHVLTAAHCVYAIVKRPLLKRFLNVVAGTNSLTSGGKSYKVEALSYYHKYYDQTFDPDFMYDIGVITLAEEITETELIKIIPLPRKTVKGGEVAVISGWGTMKSPESPASRLLRKLNVKIVSNARCQMYYYGAREIVKAHVCAYKKRGAGVCSGDSGGPLVSGGEVVGVVSGGVACAKGFPDVYTRVESYLDYIHEIIDDKEEKPESEEKKETEEKKGTEEKKETEKEEETEE